jgi:endonuclease V-like protein UPF0215 family
MRILDDQKMNRLTDKQREVWLMRYRYGWRLKRIALRMGISPQAASALVRRAQRTAGVPESYRLSVIRTKPRRAKRCMSLSDAFNY